MQYRGRSSPGSNDFTIGCPIAYAWPLACRIGDVYKSRRARTSGIVANVPGGFPASGTPRAPAACGA